MAYENLRWLRSEAELLDLLASGNAFALDTEFMRRSSYFARLALVQIADRNGVYLIDPLDCSVRAALQTLFHDPLRSKLLHSPGEDIDVLLAGEAPPQGLLDTQIAAALLGAQAQPSYKAVVEAELGVVLDKSETVSDWLQRPLSAAQIGYAASDVAHLWALHDALLHKLEQRDLAAAWVEECSLRYSQPESQSPLEVLRRNKGWERLNPDAVRRLWRLLVWREERAIAADLPRNWVLEPAQLYAFAERPPQSLAQLRGQLESRQRLAQKHSGDLFTLLRAAADGEPDMPLPLDEAEKDRIKRWKTSADQIANERGMSADLLASRRMLENYLRDSSTPLGAWRHALLADTLAT
jgi:ribonuclease D